MLLSRRGHLFPPLHPAQVRLAGRTVQTKRGNHPWRFAHRADALRSQSEWLPDVEDHGIVSSTVERDLAAAQRVMRDLEATGLPMRQVTDVLEQEGVTTFKTAFEDSLQRLDEKRQALAREQAAQGNRAAARAGGSEGHSAEVAGATSTPGGEEP